jgi:16S rRNA (cytidine1402-2'-O)-methyltransferase
MSSSSGALYVVATPIGNLSDITLRAVEVLKVADLILAEDTRRSRALLSHLGISGKPVRCLDAHANASAIEAVVGELASGSQVALLTDAGTPSVSDPGSQLVVRCHELQLKVIPIPGASAVTTAIAGSGLVDQGFWFLGFLPRKGSKRNQLLSRIAATPEAVVLFEAPPRMAATLNDLAARMPTRKICIGRELTKKFEELTLDTLAQASTTERSWRGELTLVIGPDPNAGRPANIEAADLDEQIEDALERGESAREIADRLAAPPALTRRDAYQRVLWLRNSLDASAANTPPEVAPDLD